MSISYVYSIQNDFPNHAVAPDRLTLEIHDSVIVTALDRIDTNGDECSIWFKVALSAGDTTVLDAIVAAHSGVPLVVATPKVTSDGKLIVAPFPATLAWRAWYAGAGDQLNPVVRGLGQRLRLAWTEIEARGPKTVTLKFSEPVEIQDGGVYYRDPLTWGMDDLMDLGVYMPATATTPNGGNTGNCNRVSQGAYDVIVPAAGNGAYDVVLATAVPVPANGAGYWDANHDTGVVTASATPGSGEYHLLTAAITTYFLRQVPLGNSLGTFDVDNYRSAWVHPSWDVQLTVDKQSAGAGDWAGWLMLFREYVT